MLDHGRHARLLQHDFRKPDAVRVAIRAPGKVAVVLVVPGKETPAKSPLPRQGKKLIINWARLHGPKITAVIRSVAITCSVIDPHFQARNNSWSFSVCAICQRFAAAARGSIMNDFNRKVENASARVSKAVAEAAEKIEREIPELVKYLNDEVVPTVRQHSTKALRTASQELTELADYMEQQKASHK
jgi:hypothetical protein